MADLSLDKEMLQDALRRNVWSAPSVQGSWMYNDDSCVNVSGLSRVDCCCSQARMRSARTVST